MTRTRSKQMRWMRELSLENCAWISSEWSGLAERNDLDLVSLL